MKTSCLAMLLLLALAASVAAQTPDTIREYVSSFGTKLFLRNTDSCLICNYTLFKLETDEQRDCLMELWQSMVDTNDKLGKLSLGVAWMLLKNRDFSEETFYVLVSPPTVSLTTAPPYRLADDNAVIFEIVPDSLSGATLALVRTHLCSKTDDDFADSDIYVVVGDQKIKLEPREL